MFTSLRSMMWMLAAAGLMGATACASGVTPTPTSAPVKPTAAPAAPAAASPTAAKPGTTSTPEAKSSVTPAAKPAASSEWKADWDKTLAAAKQEGKIVIVCGPGELYRNAMAAFEKAYPEIKVEVTGMSGSDFAPRLIAEREGGKYLWDVWLSGWNTPLPLKEKGLLDPLRPSLLLPEVLDESKWLGGFDNAWVDRERKYQFAFSAYINYMAYANTQVVPESEIKTVDLFVDPKWKGKIAMSDPRVSGGANVRMGVLLLLRGEDFVRKLLAQDVAVMPQSRQLAEALVRGRYPIAFGISISDLETFTQEGLTQNAKPIAPDTREGTRINTGFGNLLLINKPPHPNAAKVFANWLLSADGQKAYVEATAVNSRRLDVPPVPDRAPDPKAHYDIDEREDSPLLEKMNQAREIAKELIK